ncbi:MAG: cytochrome P450 [Cyanobacteria bacterium P01_H01_bin.15]
MTVSAEKPLPPGSFGLPIFGETIAFLTNPQFASQHFERYGDMFKTKILGSPTIVIKGAEANRFIFTGENKNFQVNWPPSVEKLLGPLSLALQTGSVHAQRRRLLFQAFQSRALASYVPTIISIGESYLQQWVQQPELAWYPAIRDYTFDIAGKLFVGLDHAAETDLGHWFDVWCQGLFTIPLNLPGTPFAKAWKCRRLLLTELEKLIRDRKTRSVEEKSDALGIMLAARDEETGEGLSVEELKDQVLLLLFAGHETLTSAIASFCLLMGQYPAVQARAREEQARYRDQPLTSQLLRKMEYLDQVIKEVLRFVPPVGGGFRKVLQDCEYEDYRIPAGWSVLYQMAATHRDESLFQDPDNFEPERFAPQRAEDKAKPFSLIPFGGGVRECIGKEFARLEMKVFAAQLLRGYEWELLPDQDLSLDMVPTPRPRDNLKVKLQRR